MNFAFAAVLSIIDRQQRLFAWKIHLIFVFVCCHYAALFVFAFRQPQRQQQIAAESERAQQTHTHIETAAAAAQLFPGDKIVAIVVQAKKKLVI